MGMNIVYDISLTEERVTVIIAKCQLALYGRWVEFNVTSYMLHENTDRVHTAITFGLCNLKNVDIRESTFDGVADGILKLSRGTGANHQSFDQVISAPTIIGQLLDYSELNNGGVPAGRTVTGSILRRIESIIETIRQKILKDMSTDEDVRQLTLQTLHERYGKITEKTLQTFLGQIDWRLMLAKAGCDDDALNVVEYAMGHNPPSFHSILEAPSTEIPLIRHAPINRFDRTTIANIKATALLGSVCGAANALEFENVGQITVHEQGYKFVIKPGEFVHTTDPNGKTARLCIHTISFACNPIDELIIAYLHIRHKLVPYMKEAIAHGAEKGFQKIPA